jgi:hypothetical protein
MTKLGMTLNRFVAFTCSLVYVGVYFWTDISKVLILLCLLWGIVCFIFSRSFSYKLNHLGDELLEFGPFNPEHVLFLPMKDFTDFVKTLINFPFYLSGYFVFTSGYYLKRFFRLSRSQSPKKIFN